MSVLDELRLQREAKTLSWSQTSFQESREGSGWLRGQKDASLTPRMNGQAMSVMSLLMLMSLHTGNERDVAAGDECDVAAPP